MGTLSIIGTPIGNLGDITLRALETLRSIDVLICEDTRITKKLLFHYEITDITLMSYDEHEHARVLPKIIELLASGKHIGIVSDAGMPAISDPGSYLINCIRNQCSDTVIQSVPGITAITTAFALSGIDTSHGFVFLGFPPHKKGRETFFKSLSKYSELPVSFYESNHRILDALSRIAEYYAETVTVTLCRELTKTFEQVLHGNAAEMLESLKTNTNFQRGEFVVLLQFGK